MAGKNQTRLHCEIPSVLHRRIMRAVQYTRERGGAGPRSATDLTVRAVTAYLDARDAERAADKDEALDMVIRSPSRMA